MFPTAAGFTLRFVGGGFARHMVRMLVGEMTAVAKVKVRLEHFQEGLVNQRNFYCATAPDPRTLWNVGYPVELDPSTAGPPGSRGGQLAALEGLGRRTIRWPRYQRRWPKKRREG